MCTPPPVRPSRCLSATSWRHHELSLTSSVRLISRPIRTRRLYPKSPSRLAHSISYSSCSPSLTPDSPAPLQVLPSLIPAQPPSLSRLNSTEPPQRKHTHTHNISNPTPATISSHRTVPTRPTTTPIPSPPNRPPSLIPAPIPRPDGSGVKLGLLGYSLLVSKYSLPGFGISSISS